MVCVKALTAQKNTASMSAVLHVPYQTQHLVVLLRKLALHSEGIVRIDIRSELQLKEEGAQRRRVRQALES